MSARLFSSTMGKAFFLGLTLLGLAVCFSGEFVGEELSCKSKNNFVVEAIKTVSGNTSNYDKYATNTATYAIKVVSGF